MTSPLHPRGIRRGHRRVATVALAAVALAASACVPLEQLPPEATEYCLTSPPTTPAQYQQAFDGLRQVWTEWAAADGAFPVDLQDGRVLWLFGDTIVGRVRANGSIANPWKLIRNSFVVQEGRCFTPFMRGPRGARSDAIAPTAANDWYWPVSGVVEDSGATLALFSLHMRYVDNSGDLFDFEFVDTSVTKYSWPSGQIISTAPVSFPAAAPADNLGESVYAAADGYLYFFGHTGVIFQTNARHYVARVPVGTEDDAAPGWEYLVDAATGSWSSDPTAALPVPFNGPPGGPTPDQNGPFDALSVTLTPSGQYVAAAKPANALDDKVRTWTSPNPFGPWTYKGEAVTGMAHDLNSTFTYGGHLVSFLPGIAPGPMLIWSQNHNPLDGIILNSWLYRAFFASPNPGSLP